MAAKNKVTVGDLVHVIFWDHAENGNAIQFEVIGRLFEVTRKEYKIRCWGYIKETDRAADERTDNECWYSIVRRAVDSIRRLK